MTSVFVLGCSHPCLALIVTSFGSLKYREFRYFEIQVDGEARIFDLLVSALRGGRVAEEGSLLLMRDVTERRGAQEAEGH